MPIDPRQYDSAIDYISELGLENIARYEHELLAYGTEALTTIPGLRLTGTAKEAAVALVEKLKFEVRVL